MSGTVLDVEPVDFVSSSTQAASVARAISAAGATLRGALSGDSRMAGSDPTGRKWAAQYDRVAADAISGVDSLEHAFGQIAAGLSVTGLNYATADWLSAGRNGHAPGYTVPSLPAAVCSAAPPSASGGTGSCDIPGWHYVADFIGDMWPDGDTGTLRHAQSAWSTFADTLDSIHGVDVPRILSALDGTTTPEQPAIRSTVATVSSNVSTLAQEANNLASACGQLADQIDRVHQQTEQELISLGEQLAATAAIGIGLTIFTAGLSDAAGALAAGGEVAVAVSRILGFIAELGTTISAVIDSIAEGAGAIGEVAGISSRITVRIVTIAGKSVVTGVGSGITNVGVQEIVDPGSDIEGAFVNGFVGGAAFGALGEGAKMAMTARAARVATEGADGYVMRGTSEALSRTEGPTVPAAAEDADGYVMRDTSEPLYRNDNRAPEVIFKDGFQPKDPSYNDLEDFVRTNSPSNFVSTTTDADLYKQWQAAYRYTIDAEGGIDVNKSFPENPFANEAEIAFQGGLPSSSVLGAHPVLPGGDLGDWIPNPGAAVK